MNESLNIKKICLDSENEQISPYKLIKRELRYHKPKPQEKKEQMRCETCRLILYPLFDGKERTQCTWIGVSSKKSANIKLNMVCDRYRKGCIPEGEANG